MILVLNEDQENSNCHKKGNFVCELCLVKEGEEKKPCLSFIAFCVG